MASKYWVGGGASTNWDATGNTNWSDTDGGANNATVPAAGDAVFLKSSANCVINVNTPALLAFDMTGYTGTLSGTSALQCTGLNGTTQVFILDGTITYTGSVTLNPGATGIINLTTNGKLFTNLFIGGGTGGQLVLQDNVGFTAVKTNTITLSTNSTLDMNGKTISGNSSINRILLISNTLGTQRTITINGGTFANADFRDINLSTNTNLSAITGLSGDCGGNANITFTTAATQYWIGRTGNWSDAAEWGTTSGGSGGRVPLPQDDVVFDANSFNAGSQTVTTDMPRLGKNINWTGVTNTPAWAKNPSFQMTVYGSITLVSGMTNSGGTTVNMEGRGAFTFTSAGLTWTNTTVVAMFGGSLTLQDAFVSLALNLNNGTFDANNFSVALTSFSSNNSNTRAIIMGNGTWTISSAPNFWVATSTMSLTANGSTIVSTSTAAKSFIGGGLVYNNLKFQGTGTANITISGSNTFNRFEDIGSAAHSLLFTAGTTQTIADWAVSGTSGNVITINSTTTATHALVKSGGGTVSSDYLNIQHSVATPATTWYAGANSTDNQAVATAGSGWIFTVPPAGGTNSKFFLVM
jgi:hypothetical protein